MGKKSEMLLLPVMAWLLYLLLTVIERFPKIWNTGVTVTEENRERVYTSAASDQYHEVYHRLYLYLADRSDAAWYLAAGMVYDRGASGCIWQYGILAWKSV